MVTPAQGPSDTPPLWAGFVRAGLRDTARVLLGRTFWSLIIGSVFLTTLAGPFGTFEDLPFARRLVYWTIGILFVTMLATALSFIAYHTTRGLGLPWPPGALAAGVLAVPPHWVLVHALDSAMLPGGSEGFWALLPYVALPVVVMTMLINGVVIKVLSLREALEAPPEAPAPVEAQSGPEPSLLFQRVPAHLGRDIVCLRAQDHYLEVVTPLGSALVLMRLSDAERDLAALRGMRVHRSWWVALDHVAEFSQAEGGGLSLTTTTGHTIPVARAQRAGLRAALDGELRRAAE